MQISKTNSAWISIQRNNLSKYRSNVWKYYSLFRCSQILFARELETQKQISVGLLVLHCFSVNLWVLNQLISQFWNLTLFSIRWVLTPISNFVCVTINLLFFKKLESSKIPLPQNILFKCSKIISTIQVISDFICLGVRIAETNFSWIFSTLLFFRKFWALIPLLRQFET